MSIKIYTLDYCPYCRRAIAFLNDKNLQYEQIRLDDNEDENLEKLAQKYDIKGEVTVPQIILNGVRIGGYDDMIKKYQTESFRFAQDVRQDDK